MMLKLIIKKNSKHANHQTSDILSPNKKNFINNKKKKFFSSHSFHFDSKRKTKEFHEFSVCIQHLVNIHQNHIFNDDDDNDDMCVGVCVCLTGSKKNNNESADNTVQYDKQTKKKKKSQNVNQKKEKNKKKQMDPMAAKSFHWFIYLFFFIAFVDSNHIYDVCVQTHKSCARH